MSAQVGDIIPMDDVALFMIEVSFWRDDAGRKWRDENKKWCSKEGFGYRLKWKTDGMCPPKDIEDSASFNDLAEAKDNFIRKYAKFSIVR